MQEQELPRIKVRPNRTVFRYIKDCPHCGKPIIIEGNPQKSWLHEVGKEQK